MIDEPKGTPPNCHKLSLRDVLHVTDDGRVGLHEVLVGVDLADVAVMIPADDLHVRRDQPGILVLASIFFTHER